jgi:aquaporin Z
VTHADDPPAYAFQHDFWDDHQEWRRLLAEFVGTFLLVLVAAGGPVIAAATGEPIGHAATVIAPGLMLAALIYTLGAVSGAHFNPAVTLAFAVRRDFPGSRVPGYLAVQLIGAVVAAAALRILFGNVGHLGATLPHLGSGTSLVMEMILTATLVLAIFGTSAAPRIVGHNAAFVVGGTVALLGLFASPVSGASMNPARSLGPDLVGGTLGSAWLYIVGPVCGALLALPLVAAFDGNPTASEKQAAAGIAEAAARTRRRRGRPR